MGAINGYIVEDDVSLTRKGDIAATDVNFLSIYKASGL